LLRRPLGDRRPYPSLGKIVVHLPVVWNVPDIE